MKFRSALSNATFWKCEVYVEMLNGFLPRGAENEALGFNVLQIIATVSTSTVLCIVPPPFAVASNEFLTVRAKVHE